MDVIFVTLLAVGLIFVLMALGTPVFAALAVAGAFGVVMVEDLAFLLARLKTFPFGETANYSLTVIPMFILMGAFAHHAQVGRRLFEVANKWVGHLPGGLAMASILDVGRALPQRPDRLSPRRRPWALSLFPR